jgi:ADP-ribosylglycohydrolase
VIRAGGFYRVTERLKVSCLYHWAAPVTTGDDVVLPSGLVIKVDTHPVETAQAVYAAPVGYHEWEPYFVPGSTRFVRRYDGYSLVIDKRDIERRCELTDGDAGAMPRDLTAVAAMEGCLLGVAVGDALGLPFEGLSPRRLDKLRAIPLRHRFFFGRGMVSDDTEHTAMAAQSLVDSAGERTEFTRRLARRLRWWIVGLPAGIGWATLRSLLKLWLGIRPEKSGVWSAGNGPAMRSPIIGVFSQGNDRLLEALTAASTRITHQDPKAIRGAHIVAKAAAVGAAGEDVPPSACMALFSEIIGGDETLANLVEKAAVSAENNEDARVFCKRLGLEKGVTGYIYHTLPVVLQIWLRHQRNYEEAMNETIRCGGDTDTVGAILGGIVGAAVGREGIPETWQAKLMEWPRSLSWLQALAIELAAVRLHGQGRTAPGVSPPGILFRNAFFMCCVLAHGFRRLLPPY